MKRPDICLNRLRNLLQDFVLNDVEKAEELFKRGPKIEFTEEYVEIYNVPDTMPKVSDLWGWCRQMVLRTVRAKAYIRECLKSFEGNSDKWEQCRDSLAGITKDCREHDIPLLVVIFPFFIELDGDYPFQPIHDIVSAFCRSEGIHVLDLRDVFRGYNGPELWVHPTDQHPNEIAHAIAADAIAGYLRNLPELARSRAESNRWHR